jgi:hypothetical protein
MGGWPGAAARPGDSTGKFTVYSGCNGGPQGLPGPAGGLVTWTAPAVSSVSVERARVVPSESRSRRQTDRVIDCSTQAAIMIHCQCVEIQKVLSDSALTSPTNSTHLQRPLKELANAIFRAFQTTKEVTATTHAASNTQFCFPESLGARSDTSGRNSPTQLELVLKSPTSPPPARPNPS